MNAPVYMRDICDRCEWVKVVDHGNGHIYCECECVYPTYEEAVAAGIRLGERYIDWKMSHKGDV